MVRCSGRSWGIMGRNSGEMEDLACSEEESKYGGMSYGAVGAAGVRWGRIPHHA